MPSENGWVSDDTLNEYFATLDIESNPDTLKYAEHLVKHPEYPEHSKQFIAHFLDYANKSFEAESSQEIKEYIASIHDGDFFWPESWNDLEFTLQTLPMKIFEDYRPVDAGDGQWDDSPVNSYRLADTLNEFRWSGDEYPPVVLKLHDDGDYEIIDGFHRSNALQILDYDTVEAWVGEAEGEYGLWTDAQLDAVNAPWTPEVISPIFPLKGYERRPEEVRAHLERYILGQTIRMYGPQNEAEVKAFNQNIEWWKDVGFTEPQPVGTWGLVTGISEINPNRPWVIGIWVTITQGGSEKHPIDSRVWVHVKDWQAPGQSRGWEKGDYMAEGEEALYWATRTNMREAEEYEIRRWLKVLRDEDPEDWDDINWEDDKVLPYDDEWHDDINWESENFFHPAYYPRRDNSPKKSAAVLFVTDDGLVGLGLRSPRVRAGNTWAAIGGFSERGETPVQTLYREVYEELGIRLPNRVEWLGSDGIHEVYLCRISKPFNNYRLNWEHTDFAWKTLEEWRHKSIHPQLRPMLSKTFLAEGRESLPYGISPQDNEKWIKSYQEKRKQWDWEDSLPSKPYADYYTSSKKNPQRDANKKRLNTGGLFLNWLKTFNIGIAGYKRQCAFFSIKPVPAQPLTRARDNNPYKSKPQDGPWNPPSEKKPWRQGGLPWDKKQPYDYDPYKQSKQKYPRKGHEE